MHTPKKPGSDYRLQPGGCKARTSGKTWEILKGDFRHYKSNSADQHMQLRRAPDGTIYFDRTDYIKRTRLKLQLLAEGPKRDLWDLFLIYSKLLS
jgi:hypothetical protein